MFESTFPKYIVEGDRIIIGKVKYHNQLVKDPKAVKGGGWYTIDLDTKTLLLYANSDEFGLPTLENIKRIVALGNVGTIRRATELNDFQVLWSGDWQIKDAYESAVAI